nr:MAG TPA_asm: hypothetical protein [Caudoviricetes sp.]
MNASCLPKKCRINLPILVTNGLYGPSECPYFCGVSQ